MRNALIFAGVLALSALALGDHLASRQLSLGASFDVADVHLSLEAKAGVQDD